MEEGTALPPFPGEAAPPPRRMEPALDRDPMMRGQMEQERTVPGITESHQNTGNRDTKASGTARNASDEVQEQHDNTRGSDKQRGQGGIGRKG